MRFKKSHLKEGLRCLEAYDNKINKSNCSDTAIKEIGECIDALPDEIASLDNIVQSLYNFGYSDVNLSRNDKSILLKAIKHRTSLFIYMTINKEGYMIIDSIYSDGIFLKGKDDPFFKLSFLMLNSSNIVVDVLKDGLIANRNKTD